MVFKRTLSNSLRVALKQSELFNSKLIGDIKNGEIYPAIRENCVDFYNKGGRLFRFNKSGFQTHIKYAAVIPNQGQDYLTEKELSNYRFSVDFDRDYERIKENCANYSNIEALGVSELYNKFHYLSDSNIVILDIEIAFKSTRKKIGTDRIDMLLYNIEQRKLKFVEVKHYSNNDIWLKGKYTKAINQISRYEEQIRLNSDRILTAYENYIKIINSLFDLQLPPPESIEEKVTLLIFGYDEDQKNGRLDQLILGNRPYRGVMHHTFLGRIVYCKGDLQGFKMSSLWRAKPL